MNKKYVYVISSGTLNKTTNQYFLQDTYWSSRVQAERAFENTLEVNRADVLETYEARNPKRYCGYGGITLRKVDYIGEDGLYKARIVLTKKVLNQ